MDSDGSGETERMQVIVVPLPAQGHLNQLLHFSRAIAGHGVSVLYVATSTHIRQVRHRVQGWDLHKFDIRFQELPMPDLQDGHPDTTHVFPTHLIPLFEAMEDVLQPHFDRLVRSICSHDKNKVVIVYDSVMGWAQTVATKYGIPSYVFRSGCAYFYLWLTQARGQTGTGLSPVNISVKRCFPELFSEFLSKRPAKGPAKGYIINTFYALESEFIDEGKKQLVYEGKPVWAVGPLLPQIFFNDAESEKPGADMECMRWLNRQAPSSVIYVSFGTMSSLSPSQIREIAEGLERSGQPFLWVLRISDGANFSTDVQSDWICKFLPDGYERRIQEQERGFIVRNWAPQIEILFHRSTGGFLTHCGWNSTVESMSAGVPMVAWPLHSDQFANSALIAEVLKIGVGVKEWRNTEEIELVSAGEIEEAVKRVMVNEEGMEMRKRAKLLRGEARKAVGEGGSSSSDLNSLLSHFSQHFHH